jgi:type I restriction enzyme, S subunit
VTPLFDRAEVAEDESETLAQLRDTLLPKLVSGEIRLRAVPDATKGSAEAKQTWLGTWSTKG